MKPRNFLLLASVSLIMGAILFTTARTFDYWQAWLYLALAFASQFYIVADLAKRDPELLARRRKAGSRAEVRPVQKRIIRLTIIAWVVAPAIAGFDHRFGWSQMSPWLTWLGAAMFIAGQAGFVWVFRSNTYARATVEVSEGQTLAETGPYALMRHPMYTVMLWMSVAMTLILGSWWTLIPAALTVPLLAWRLLDEEKMMVEELPGYPEYMRKVRFRLVPGVW